MTSWWAWWGPWSHWDWRSSRQCVCTAGGCSWPSDRLTVRCSQVANGGQGNLLSNRLNMTDWLLELGQSMIQTMTAIFQILFNLMDYLFSIPHFSLKKCTKKIVLHFWTLPRTSKTSSRTTTPPWSAPIPRRLPWPRGTTEASNPRLWAE